jgi:hypothetical protein
VLLESAVATPTLAPQPIPDDLFPLTDLVELLRPTPHPATRSTIERWIADYGIQGYRLGGKKRYSFTAVMKAQRDVAARRRRRT